MGLLSDKVNIVFHFSLGNDKEIERISCSKKL